MKLYRIRDWNEVYETAETRKLENLRWVPVPNKLDGLGFRRVAAQRDRSDLLAAWILILEVASKGRRGERGILARDGQPLDAEDLALMTGFPVAVFERALSFFSDSRQGWLLAAETSANTADEVSQEGQPPSSPSDPLLAAASPAESPARPAETSAEGNGRERKGKEEKRAAKGSPPAPALSDSEWLAELGQNAAYRGINVPIEYARMEAWCATNRKEPNRRRFINWLNRCDRPMRVESDNAPSFLGKLQ